MAGSSTKSLRTILGILVAVAVFVAVTGLLMTSLRSAKMAGVARQLRARPSYGPDAYYATSPAAGDETGVRPARPPAQVKSFAAEIVLTPRLSVGTERPEAIYEASFRADIEAVHGNPREGQHECEVHLPLPPELISLAGLSVSVNGEPSENLRIDGGTLVWWGTLDASKPAKLEMTYTAVGKGVYTLTPPAGRIIDRFRARLACRFSDVRMLELSLQPGELQWVDDGAVYEWDYERLMFGRPIAIDVLGIAPPDRLAELCWLGPIGVLVFGVLFSMVALAAGGGRIDKWMLLMILGAFAGTYPLMYFAQDFLPLPVAAGGACLLVVAIIAVRAGTLLGARAGLAGGALLAAAVQALTLWATLQPRTQGLLLTALAIGALVTAMSLLRRVQRSLAAEPAAPAAAPPPPPALSPPPQS